MSLADCFTKCELSAKCAGVSHKDGGVASDCIIHFAEDITLTEIPEFSDADNFYTNRDFAGDIYEDYSYDSTYNGFGVYGCYVRRTFVAGTTAPTSTPTVTGTTAPTSSPTAAPTSSPTSAPSVSPTAVPTASPSLAPTSNPTTSASCQARVLAVVDMTFPKFWNEQYQRAYGLINKLITAYDGNVTNGGVRLGISEIDDQQITDVVDIDTNDAIDETGLLATTNQKKTETNGKKSSMTMFGDLFELNGYLSTLADDTTNSYIILFSDGVSRQSKSVKRALDLEKKNLPGSRIKPMVICVQTWRIVSSDKLFRGICDKKLIVDFRDQTDDDLASQIVQSTCVSTLTNPCSNSAIKKAGRCRAVARNPTTGLIGTTPQVKICKWNKKARQCSVKPEYASLFGNP